MPGPLRLPPLAPAADGSDGFDVLNWKVFGPGYWKGEFFPPERCRRIAANYRVLKDHNPDYAPKGKFGHDRLQRLAVSMGLPNVGWVSDLRPTPDDGFEIDVRSVPNTALVFSEDDDGGRPVLLDLRKRFEAGGWDGGSIELVRRKRHPERPSEWLEDVFDGVAFLGEENPAVAASARPRPSPRQRSDYSAGCLRLTFSDFSETPPMTREQMVAALAAALDLPPDDPTFTTATDEQIQQAYDAQAAGAEADAVKAMLPAAAPTPAPTPAPDQPAFMAEMRKLFSEFSTGVTRRLSAVEAAVTDVRKKGDDAATGALMSEAARRVDECIKAGKLLPRLREQKLADLKALAPNTKTFSDGADKGLTAFQAELKALEARQPDLMFSDQVADQPVADPDELDDWDKKAMAADARGKLVLHHQKQKAAAGK